MRGAAAADIRAKQHVSDYIPVTGWPSGRRRGLLQLTNLSPTLPYLACLYYLWLVLYKIRLSLWPAASMTQNTVIGKCFHRDIILIKLRLFMSSPLWSPTAFSPSSFTPADYSYYCTISFPLLSNHLQSDYLWMIPLARTPQ